MKINGICFSKDGIALAERIQTMFENNPVPENADMEWYCKSNRKPEKQSPVRPLNRSLHEWTEEVFNHSDVLVFISALGIAVRAIAPFVRDKRSDPAVICLDEKGTFCIAVLSGHIGGANHFTEVLAKQLGSIPVITTATDIHGKFAVDVYAAQHDYVLSNMTYAKEVSAAIIGGETVGFYTPFPIVGTLPEGLVWSEKFHDENAEHADGISIGIYISPSFSRAYFDHTLWLIPKCLTLGIGCKKDTRSDVIEEVVKEMLDQNCFYQEAVSAVATIDLKEDERGLLKFCKRNNLPLHIYTADELKEAEGTFTASEFVEETTGVDNVCERAAVLDSRNRKLIVKKYSRDGVTCALAITDWTVEFDAS